MVATTKIAQSYVNAIAEEAERIKIAAARLSLLRTRWQMGGHSVTGTVLEGRLAAVSTWVDNIVAVADAAVANQAIALRLTSHEGKAL